MELKILGSSSAGNCYVLDNGTEALAVECGVCFAEVKRAVGFDIGRIAGCIVSHEHGDHAREAGRFAEARIEVGMSAGTARAIGLEGKPGSCARPLSGGVAAKFGSFTVMPFPVLHDAAEPFGYLVNHPETGTVLFATDTRYLAYRFAGLNNVMMECNYRLDILDRNTDSGLIARDRRERTILSHMSYGTCLKTLLANDLTGVNNIVLIHLSEDNSHAEEFRSGIAEATGKTVYAAKKGMTLNFNKIPF